MGWSDTADPDGVGNAAFGTSVSELLRMLIAGEDSSGNKSYPPFKMYGDADGTATALALDKATSTLVGIDSVHHDIHEGDHYFMQGFVTLDNGETHYVKLVTPDTTKWGHFRWEISSSGILTTHLYEAPTGGNTGGTGVTPLNNNRNSSNTSGMTITSGVTVSTGATIDLDPRKHGSTGFKSVSGGSGGRDDEIVLKQNTVYSREFVSGSDANIVSFRASWYEHADVA